VKDNHAGARELFADPRCDLQGVVTRQIEQDRGEIVVDDRIGVIGRGNTSHIGMAQAATLQCRTESGRVRRGRSDNEDATSRSSLFGGGESNHDRGVTESTTSKGGRERGATPAGV
jgi:hypothetical protein